MPRTQKLPKRLQPMLATLTDAPFDDPGWVFEMKWDGFRLVASIEKRSVTLYSRNGLIVSDNYKPIAKALERVRQDCVIETTTILQPIRAGEMGMVKFTFSGDGRVFNVVGEFSALREPSISIPAAVTELTGIGADMVAGQRINVDEAERFIADAVLVIAHGASFDRPFCEAFIPAFANKHWACSNTEVEWQARHHRGSKLTYLLNDFGLFYEGHRALDDCYALLEVLAATTPHATGTALDALLQMARKATVRIWAQAAPFQHKDTLKARGYRWSDGSGEAPRAWWKDIDEAMAEAELAFLRTDIYQDLGVELPAKRFTSLQRFSGRVRWAG